MASLAIEQKLQEHGYQRNEPAQVANNQINLGGFAVSFEDLLQRVGARLDNAFSAADKSGGITTASDKADIRNDSRDYGKDRADNGNRDDHRAKDDPSEHGRTTAADARDNNTGQRSEAPASDNAADNATTRTDNADRDGQGGHESKDTADNSADNGSNNDGTKDAAGDNASNGTKGEQSADNGKKAATGDGAANTNAGQQGHNVTQAAAVYAAGLVGNKGNETGKSTEAAALTQAQKGADVSENPVVQAAAAAKTAKNGQANHGSTQNNQNAQNKTANAREQKAAGADQKSAGTSTQNQAQQLSRMVGSDARTNISVNVTNEQTQLTSKPTFTIANGSVLTQDAGNGQGNATNAQTGQQQGQNPGQSQQAQLAAQQQAQAAQQANMQNAQQGPQGGSVQASTNTPASVQAANGGTQHAGGNEAMNNSNQAANATQQSQQTQQTRESAPQQQAQHAQRNNLPGSAVTEQISVKITKALQAGTDRISIQLKPAELGRVDVKMEMTHDGRVMTVVTAEKQDTLDLLRRDSSELQKALADAGLNSGDMEFNLKGQEQQSAEAETNSSNSQSADEADANGEEATDPNDGVMSAWESGIFANGRLDMRA